MCVKLNIVLMKHRDSNRSNQRPECNVYSKQLKKSHYSLQWEGSNPSHSLTEAGGSVKCGRAQCSVQSETSTCCDKCVVIGDTLQAFGTFKIYFELQIRSVY